MITSRDNTLIKQAAGLHQKKNRDVERLYIAEGIHLVREALAAGATIRHYFWTEKLLRTEEGKGLLQQLKAFAEDEVSESVMAKLGETETPQGVLAVIEKPVETILSLAGVTFGLVLDGLQDPGNVGTIIRTAWGAGADCLLLTPGSADPYQGKVVRASMGGIFYQKIHPESPPERIWATAEREGLQIIAGDPTAQTKYFHCDMKRPTLILVGSEGRGLSAAWNQFPVQKANIPQPGRAESLNAAVSAAILSYELIRQRLG